METISTSWHSYPSIYTIGHKYIKDIFDDVVLIEEKIDGSQFSFGRFNGELKCKSKGAVINTEYPEKMFSVAVEVVKKLDLKDGYTYRGEYLQKPKHNALAYDRIPNGHIIIFDINYGEESYLTHLDKQREAWRIGLEVVPELRFGKIDNPEDLLNLLETTSILGGQKIEGFVVKNYSKFLPDKKVMMGKYVSEAFKEVHNNEWKASNPGNSGIVDLLIAKYKTPARWDKAILHMKEQGKIEGIPQDIGILLREVGNDILKECEQEIKQELFDWAWDKIRRGFSSGFAEYYKEKILKDSFSEVKK